jgi:hypothetical protein
MVLSGNPFVSNDVYFTDPSVYSKKMKSPANKEDHLSLNKDGMDDLKSMTDTEISTWPSDVDFILENIRCNSIIMSEYHKNNYFILLSRLKYFRIPIIIISAFASVLNIGLQPFLDQMYISIICCMLSLVTGLIGSIELFLQVQKKMENELMNSRDFYLNAIDIYKVLSLEPEHRNGDGLKYLDGKFALYCKMIENSNVLDKKIHDQLAPIEKSIIERVIKPENATSKRFHPVGMTNVESLKKNNKLLEKSTETFDSFPSRMMKGFHEFFWSKPPNISAMDEESETGSIATEERFNIYCDLLQHASTIENHMLAKLTSILTSPDRTVSTVSIEERIQIYTYMLELSRLHNNNDYQLDKLKEILIGHFFKHKERKAPSTKGTPSAIQTKLVESILDNKNQLDEPSLKVLKKVLLTTDDPDATKSVENNLLEVLIDAQIRKKQEETDIEQGNQPDDDDDDDDDDLQSLRPLQQNHTFTENKSSLFVKHSV